MNEKQFERNKKILDEIKELDHLLEEIDQTKQHIDDTFNTMRQIVDDLIDMESEIYYEYLSNEGGDLK